MDNTQKYYLVIIGVVAAVAILLMLNSFSGLGLAGDDMAGQFTRVTLSMDNKVMGRLKSTCVVPYDGMIITKDTKFCPGYYNLPHGIRTNGSNIVLDCNCATLDGTGTTYPYNFGIITSPYGWFGGIIYYGWDKLNPSYFHNNIEIQNCILRNYDTGINIFLTERAIVHDNEVYNFKEAINIMDSKAARIYDNWIETGEYSGIRFYDTTLSSAYNNHVEDVIAGSGGGEFPPSCTGSGISFDGLRTNKNSAYKNDLIANCWGVTMWPDTWINRSGVIYYAEVVNNAIYNNNIKDSVLRGIYTFSFGYGSGDDNGFTRNNLINNYEQALDVWSNVYESNYWGYCADLDKDDVCDNPYLVPVNNIDPVASSVLN